ncbi:uncharacterized protein A4U43_C05F22110 [Asparagus officinalis]|uniref:Transmembrane protein n=1 Tax=Asparagus officinalis TaxID=4686 RepID=A0A5P1EW19_ASPOF|nr:uncharacterized protein A4U43_C05F22110 [Asparagus officinalis]
MGTREVYEEKLRSANLHYDPTINPGLGSARCPRCLSLIDPNSRYGEWTITSVLHDLSAVAGSGIGIPLVQKHVKGPKWMQIATGVPPLVLFSGVGAAFGAYAVPKFAQLTVSSYYAAYSASHYAISQATRRIERVHSSEGLHDKSR